MTHILTLGPTSLSEAGWTLGRKTKSQPGQLVAEILITMSELATCTIILLLQTRLVCKLELNNSYTS